MMTPAMPSTLLVFAADRGQFVVAIGADETFFDSKPEALAFLDDQESMWAATFGYTYEPVKGAA